MLTKNANFWLNTMLIIAFFPNMNYGITRICVSEKYVNLLSFLILEHRLIGQNLRVIVSEKVREVH